MSTMTQILATCYATPFSDETAISSECFIQGLRLYTVRSLSPEIQYHNVTHTSMPTPLQ